jgi:hypothetical protein
MDDGLYKVYQDDVCTLCGEFLLDDDRPLTIVESGRMDPMKRDPSFLKFVPDHLSTDSTVVAEALVSVFHTECLLTNVREGSWGRFSPQQCDACERHFLKEIPRWAFRLRVGGVGLDEVFIVDLNPANLAILCPDCFRIQIGEEEEEEGEFMEEGVGY